MLPLLCLGILFTGFPPGELCAQKSLLRTEFYSVDEGLPDRQVKEIIQDNDGFLWVGTPNGLARFDGYEFINFNDHPDNRYKISRSDIRELKLDKAGNIIIFYENVSYEFDILNPHSLTARKVVPADSIGNGSHPLNIYVSREGEIFLLNSNQENGFFLYNYDPELNKYTLVFRLRELQNLGAAYTLEHLADGSFLLNDPNLELRHFDSNGNLLNSLSDEIRNCFNTPINYPGNIHFMHRDNKGIVWISFQNTPGVLRFDPATGNLEKVEELPARTYTHIWEDKVGNLLVAEEEITSALAYDTHGLFCFDAEGTMHDFSQLTEINNRIQFVYGANFFKTVYLGHESGLSIVQNNRPKVTTYLATNMRDYMRGARMRGVVADSEGLVYFAREEGSWYVLDDDINYLDTLALIDRQTGERLDFGCALDLKLDSLGNLWGITCSNSGNGQLNRLNLNDCLTDTYLSEYQFTAMAQARNGNFWLAGKSRRERGVLLSFDTASKEFTPLLDSLGENPLRNNPVQYILEGQEGLLWVGTENGLFKIDLQSRSFTLYTGSIRNSGSGLSSSNIYVIHQDTSGLVWLGTRNGINILNPATDEVQIIDKRNGLPNNNICGILPDGQGNYWISTYNGLSYYEPDKAQSRNFFTADGFSHDEFNRFSFARDPYNNRMYFGGMNGMNAFYQGELLVSEPPPPVVLTRLTLYNSSLDSLISVCEMLCEEEKINISPYVIYFQFNFMLPNFSSPHRNQYAAWLEGYEKEWINLGSSPSIRYSKLPPGQYTLHLNGADPNGNWSLEPISIKINVERIFYKTWWFLVLVGISAIGLLYGWLKYRLEQKLKVERLRTKISSDLHDEVSGLLGGIAMQTDLLQEMVDDLESQLKLKQIGEKIRRAMSKMGDVIWSIDSRNDKLDDLLLRMYEHAAEVLNGLDVQYEFHIGNLDRQVIMPVKIRQELYFIFKEAINNIAKHSNANKVDIHIGNKGNQFEMVIHDNGKVKTPSRTYKTGQGLANIRMRAERIKADLDILNGDGYTINITMKKFA